MRSSAPGMSPEKIAIAVAVTIAATAGTGGMKNVIGTSSAVAIVAVRPGMQPTNRPNRAEHKITVRTYGSKTSANACAYAATTTQAAHPRAGAHAAACRKSDE